MYIATLEGRTSSSLTTKKNYATGEIYHHPYLGRDNDLLGRRRHRCGVVFVVVGSSLEYMKF